MISVVDEYVNGSHDDARIKAELSGIQFRLQHIFERSQEEQRPTNTVADAIAEETITTW